MLLRKSSLSALLTLAIATLVNLSMLTAARAEPAESAAAKPQTVKPLARIGKETAGFHVNCFALAPGGDLVALGTDKGNIHLWSLAGSKVIRAYEVVKNGYVASIE